MSQSIGPNTNAFPELISSDCVLLAGEDAVSSEPPLARYFGGKCAEHAFRSYVFQRRKAVTTIISGMGTGCIEPLLWELAQSKRVRRIVLAGTAGAMPRCNLAGGLAYVISEARAAGAGLEAIGVAGSQMPRWNWAGDIPTASAVSTDFYYGYGQAVLRPDHPLHDTRLPKLFEEAREDLVDMEVACFYALASRFMGPDVQFVAVKSATNPAGEGAVHLANTPRALDAALELALRLLS